MYVDLNPKNSSENTEILITTILILLVMYIFFVGQCSEHLYILAIFVYFGKYTYLTKLYEW